MLPFSWYENATAAIRDQKHAKWQSIPTPRPLLVVQTQAPLWGVNRPKEQRGATHRRGTRSHPFSSTLLPYKEALNSALMNLNSSPCAFPLLCWLKKGEDLHDLLRKFQVLMTSPVNTPIVMTICQFSDLVKKRKVGSASVLHKQIRPVHTEAHIPTSVRLS